MVRLSTDGTDCVHRTYDHQPAKSSRPVPVVACATPASHTIPSLPAQKCGGEAGSQTRTGSRTGALWQCGHRHVPQSSRRQLGLAATWLNFSETVTESSVTTNAKEGFNSRRLQRFIVNPRIYRSSTLLRTCTVPAQPSALVTMRTAGPFACVHCMVEGMLTERDYHLALAPSPISHGHPQGLCHCP